jgi:hypothetical protein
MSTQSKVGSWLRGKASSVGALCLALVLAGLTLPTPVWAVDIYNIMGPYATASFSTTDPTGCIVTNVNVYATDGRQQNPPGPPTASSVADVIISQYDDCAGALLLSGFGEATLTREAFQVTGQSISATLNATVPVTDSVTGSTFNVEVALTWTGTGELTRVSDRYHDQEPGFTFESRSEGTVRPAVTSGSVSLAGTNLTPQPSYYAFLGSAKSGVMLIYKR